MEFIINVTPIIQVILEVLFASVLVALAVKAGRYVREKYTEEQIQSIKQWAYIACKAAEQLYESGHGEEKLNYALNFVTTQLLDHGIELDISSIRAYIEAEVLEINQTFWNNVDYDELYKDFDDSGYDDYYENTVEDSED